MPRLRHLFAQAKIVCAFQRTVKELGRADVRITLGSWDFFFLLAADRFLPEGIPLIPLDWKVLNDESIFETVERRASVAQVGSHRPVIPITWAYHDDGNYVSRLVAEAVSQSFSIAANHVDNQLQRLMLFLAR